MNIQPANFLGGSLGLFVAVLLLCGVGLLGPTPKALADTSVADRAKATVDGTVEKVQDAAEDATDKATDLWRKIDKQRLRNRTPDEIVAWVIMGVLVGGVSGMFTGLGNSGSGWFARIGLGLSGSFIGGIVAHLSNVDFGMGPVLIRYEDLLMALVGAIVLVIIGKLLRKSSPAKQGQ